MRGSCGRDAWLERGALAVFASLMGCSDLSGFSTADAGSYEGPVIDAPFVLAGETPGTRLCLTIDTDHLQDRPGAMWTNDALFHATPMRPIPQIWHDPLSTLSFGEGRVKNLVYVATSSASDDAFVVLSLMQSGHVEARLLRGAPGPAADGSAASGGNLFAIFDLSRQGAPCSF